jgi:hypothetical protein
MWLASDQGQAIFFESRKKALSRVRILLTTRNDGTRMILHFSAHQCARGVLGNRKLDCASGVCNEGDIGNGFGWELSGRYVRLRRLLWGCAGAYNSALHLAFLVLAF